MSVLDEPAVLEVVAEARAAGRRVVFTNGTFDLLHGGHLRVLEAAAALGDVLVVGVNDDESVRRLRGPSRPVMAQDDRAALVAALGCVDHVVLFPDDTVDRLLELLRPAVHAKGTDYDDSTLPERETNARLGIETAYVGGVKERSASALLARVAAAAGATDPDDPWEDGGVAGRVLRRARAFLREHGWLDLRRLTSTDEGALVEGTERRWVRRIVVEGTPLYVKVVRPAERKRSPLVEYENHLALRAAGFRAPEPWLCGVGPVDDVPTSVLVTREAPGMGLDQWLRDHLETLPPRARAAVARGIGSALRALHTARFVSPDLQAWHLLVDGSPIGGRATLTFIDLQRLERAGKAVSPTLAAQGLAALALSLRPVTDARFRLRILRAYRNDTLRGARPWIAAIEKRSAKIQDRGTFRHLRDEP